MKIFVAIIFYLVYWLCCFLGTGTDKKNLIGLRSYPDTVQNVVREQHEFCKTAPKEKSIISILLGNLILFTAIFSLLSLLLKNPMELNEFKATFLFFLMLGEGLGVFDLLIIDLLWWRNTKRIRFSFLPEKKYYQNPKKHIASFLRGIPMFTIVALLSAELVMLFGR